MTKRTDCAASRQISPEVEDPSPPPIVGMVMADEIYHKVGFANDLVFVKASDGRVTVSDFNVRKEDFFGIVVCRGRSFGDRAAA